MRRAESSIIYLQDVATDQPVQGILQDAIEEAQLVDWELRWQPAMVAILQKLAQDGVPTREWPQSRHWNWLKKTARSRNLLAYRGLCVVVDGITQGLSLHDFTKVAREPSQVGKPLVYVDYLEVAPWNQAIPNCQQQLRGVGRALLNGAISLSESEGFMGRIGLHSLPQAESFYRRRGMVDLGPDEHYEDMHYFELTTAQAYEYLSNGVTDETRT